MRDRDVRVELRRRLHALHGDETSTLILDELGLRHGASRVDIAVVNGSLHGYEIKSDSDTFERLQGQVRMYTAVLDFATLVVGAKHAKQVRNKVPRWWGLKIAEELCANNIHISDMREPSMNPSVDPIALAELLWRPEAASLLEQLGASPKLLRSSRSILYKELTAALTLNQLRDAVRFQLKARKGWLDHQRLL